MIKIHEGVVWIVDIRNGWYWALKPFPEAVKKIDKDTYGPDVEHRTVLQYIKSISPLSSAG